jgi:hypothetical protein
MSEKKNYALLFIILLYFCQYLLFYFIFVHRFNLVWKSALALSSHTTMLISNRYLFYYYAIYFAPGKKITPYYLLFYIIFGQYLIILLFICPPVQSGSGVIHTKLSANYPQVLSLLLILYWIIFLGVGVRILGKSLELVGTLNTCVRSTEGWRFGGWGSLILHS